MKCTRIVGRRTLIILMFDDFAPLAFFQQIHGIASWARYFFPCGYILAIPNMQGLGETVSHIFHTHTHTHNSALTNVFELPVALTAMPFEHILRIAFS